MEDWASMVSQKYWERMRGLLRPCSWIDLVLASANTNLEEDEEENQA
jgi:hypothetical protein